MRKLLLLNFAFGLLCFSLDCGEKLSLVAIWSRFGRLRMSNDTHTHKHIHIHIHIQSKLSSRSHSHQENKLLSWNLVGAQSATSGAVGRNKKQVSPSTARVSPKGGRDEGNKSSKWSAASCATLKLRQLAQRYHTCQVINERPAGEECLQALAPEVGSFKGRKRRLNRYILGDDILEHNAHTLCVCVCVC